MKAAHNRRLEARKLHVDIAIVARVVRGDHAGHGLTRLPYLEPLHIVNVIPKARVALRVRDDHRPQREVNARVCLDREGLVRRVVRRSGGVQPNAAGQQARNGVGAAGVGR